MLILERRRGESVDLTDLKTKQLLASIKVLEILPSGNVRLGFDALPNIHIKRDNMKENPHEREPAEALDDEDDNRGNR